MFIFETLVIAFYISQNYDIGLPPLDGLPHSPPRDTARKALAGSGRNGSTRKQALQGARWRGAIDWWSQTCSHCVGCNRQERNHCLSQCTSGGAKLLKKGIGKALYERTHAPDSACDWCYLPKDLCDKWVKKRHYDWRRKEGSRSVGTGVISSATSSSGSYRVRIADFKMQSMRPHIIGGSYAETQFWITTR